MENMHATVGVYENHKQAIEAVKILGKNGLSTDKISLIGKADVIEDHLHTYSTEPLKNTPVMIGAVLGPTLGVLTGIGIATIPGLGFLFGAGALVGAMGGLGLGVAGGGLSTLLMSAGINKDKIVSYKKHLEMGKYLVIINGNSEDVKKAKHALHTESEHFEVEEHL